MVLRPQASSVSSVLLNISSTIHTKRDSDDVLAVDNMGWSPGCRTAASLSRAQFDALPQSDPRRQVFFKSGDFVHQAFTWHRPLTASDQEAFEKRRTDARQAFKAANPKARFRFEEVAAYPPVHVLPGEVSSVISNADPVVPKGILQLLRERGLYEQGMHTRCDASEATSPKCCGFHVLEREADFRGTSASVVTQVIEAIGGHRVIFLPKFHVCGKY
jgi:hypothetical protein